MDHLFSLVIRVNLLRIQPPGPGWVLAKWKHKQNGKDQDFRSIFFITHRVRVSPSGPSGVFNFLRYRFFVCAQSIKLSLILTLCQAESHLHLDCGRPGHTGWQGYCQVNRTPK